MKEFIAEFGAKAVLDVKDHDRLTCLKRSIDKKNNASLTWLLLQNGADPNDALSSAVNWGSFAHLEILLAYGAKADNDYSQALFRAADRQPFGEEERKMMRLLLQNGADPTAEKPGRFPRKSPFMWAVFISNYGAIQELAKWMKDVPQVQESDLTSWQRNEREI